LPKGGSVPDKGKMMKRVGEIVDELTAIAWRRAKPPWIPQGGEMSYLCWRDYIISDRVVMPYPGSRLAQPGWFLHDVNGFNDLEAWCHLKHEQVTLMQAMKLVIPEDDKVWLKDD
jgi:hypothetical protein